jgi:hypothetical protein
VTGETVTIRRPDATSDRYGNAGPDWSSVTDTAVAGVAVAPRLEGEDRTLGRQGVVVGLTLYLPPGSDIAATDRVVVRGDVYEVDGEPGDWRSPHSTAKGIEVAVRRVAG